MRARETPLVGFWDRPQGEVIPVGPVNLLGTRVTAQVRLNRSEAGRRNASGVGPVTDPALLECLHGLPLRRPVCDPALWAETSGLPDGVVDRGDPVDPHLAGFDVHRLDAPESARRVRLREEFFDAAGETCRYVYRFFIFWFLRCECDLHQQKDNANAGDGVAEANHKSGTSSVALFASPRPESRATHSGLATRYALRPGP